MTAHAWTLGDVFVLRHAGFPFDWLESVGVGAEVMVAIHELLDHPEDSACYRTAEAAYVADRRRLRDRLRELATDSRVQEAVFLSSPDMFENVWVRYVERASDTDNSASRRVERQVYAYLQRLCAKNETTSFFGPVGYGELAGDDDAIEFSSVTPRRRTWIAYWAVEALASRAALEPELWYQLPIRRNPLFLIDRDRGEARCESIAQVVTLDAAQLRLLAELEITDQASELVVHLGWTRDLVETIAMTLFETGVLVRRLWFRSDQPDALGNLCAVIAALPACEARKRWLDDLARLDDSRARFETALLAVRRTLLPRMEAEFSELAHVEARRAGGRLYTDRLIINEEASSPFQLRIGAQAARAIAASLSPLLELGAAAGREYHDSCATRAVEQLAAPVAMGFLDYAARLRELHVPLAVPRIEADASHVRELPAKLGIAGDDESRFALPDVCLGRDADRSVRVVLARMHHQLLTRGWMFSFHPDQARVDRVATTWLRDEADALVELASGRHNKGYYTFPGPRVAHAIAELGTSGHVVYAAADLRVTFDDGRPRLRAPDGTPIRLYMSLADLTLHAPFAALAHPAVLKPRIECAGEHTPRLDLGAATYQRESWDLTLPGSAKLSGFALFVKVQEERRRLGLPRFVFARVTTERKPFLVDLDCPFAIELLRHHARSGTAQLEEMLPTPDQLWLRDEAGRYTFELRMQATRVL
jgi:Lantibiotic dehydratase, N terminus